MAQPEAGKYWQILKKSFREIDIGLFLRQTRAQRALSAAVGRSSLAKNLGKATSPMTTGSSQASFRSVLSGTQPPPPLIGGEFPTVEESPEQFDLIGLLRQSVTDGSQPIDAILASVADASRVMTGADGTALGLETKGTIVCRARSGDTAPPIGAAINTESGISGECLRGAATLVCYDTLSDPRVDAEVCQALGIRSIAAIPLLEGARGVGILEAFSARPDAFDGDALSSLRALAEVAQLAYQRESAITPAIVSPDTTAVATPAAPLAPSSPPSDPLAPFRQAVKYTPRTFTKEELSSAKPRNKKIWLAAIALGLLAVVVAWWSWHSPDEGVGSTKTAHAATVANVTANSPVRDVLPKPVAGVSAKRAPAGSRPDIVMQNAAEIQSLPGQSAEAADSAPASTPSAPATDKAVEAEVIEPPAVNISSSANSEQLARLTSSEAHMPVGGPLVSQGVVQAVLLHKVDPTYPVQARTQRLSGKVVVTATIGTDGTIRNLTLDSGSPILGEAAKSALRQWRYRPATLNGTPVEVQKDITFVFQQP